MKTVLLACMTGAFAYAPANANEAATNDAVSTEMAEPEGAVSRSDAETKAAAENFAVFVKNMELLAAAEKLVEEEKALSHFGAGPAMTMNLSKHDRVDEAALDENGILRLTKQSDASVGIFLEAHYLWEVDHLLPFKMLECPKKNTRCGFGPFVGVQPGGSGDIIEGVGAGFMWGFKGDGEKNLFKNSQLNLGVGVFIDPNVKTLGAGLVRDQPLPVGETAIRYEEDFQANLMVIFTVNPF